VSAGEPAAPAGERRRALAPALALAFLYLTGVVHWLLFFNLASAAFRGPSFSVEDWPKEYRYYSILQQAVRGDRVPFYVSRPIHTRKFLALPEVSWSPQLLLLRFMPVGAFVVANTLLLYSAGFAGLLLIRRRYSLGLLPFAFLFAIFAFNGHVTAHLAVGHSMWVGYFLLPFVLLLLDVWPLGRLTPASAPADPGRSARKSKSAASWIAVSSRLCERRTRFGLVSSGRTTSSSMHSNGTPSSTGPAGGSTAI